MKMAGPEKELNKHRPTICRNCIHFDDSKRFYEKDMCGYHDIEADADDDTKCRYYREVGDPI